MNILPLVGWYWDYWMWLSVVAIRAAGDLMGGTSPMCFSPIKIGQKEEETKKASFLHPLHRIWPHFWLLWRQMNFAWIFLRGLKKKIYMKPRLNLSWVDVSLREPVDFQILIFISNLGVELTIYWHENDQINLIPDWIMFKCLKKFVL